MTVVEETAHWLLPAEAYWSSDWFALEQQQLFARCWNFVGTLDDLAGGATLVTTVAGTPVAIDLHSGADATAIALGATDSDSAPDTAPGAPKGELRTSCGSVDHWCGLVFAHLDPAAPPLVEWLGELPDRIGGFRPDRLVEVARHRFVLHANWKFFVENHVDVYHLWYLHADSLGAYDHPQAEWDNTGPHWVFYEPPRAGVDTNAESFWRGLLPVTHVGPERWGSGAHLIFPSLTFATGAGFFMTYQCIPTGPETSVIDMRVRAERGSDATSMLALSQEIIEHEDGAACEAMQEAVRSPWFSVGPLARGHELPIARFHRTVLDAMR